MKGPAPRNSFRVCCGKNYAIRRLNRARRRRARGSAIPPRSAEVRELECLESSQSELRTASGMEPKTEALFHQDECCPCNGSRACVRQPLARAQQRGCALRRPQQFGWCLACNVRLGSYVHGSYLACSLFRRTLHRCAPVCLAGFRCEARLNSGRRRALHRPAA